MLWCSTNGVGPFPNGYSVFITCFPLLHFYCCKHRAVGQLEKPKALELRNVNGFNFMALWIREGDAAMALNWVHTELIFWPAVAGRVLLGWQQAAQACRQAPSPAGWSNCCKAEACSGKAESTSQLTRAQGSQSTAASSGMTMLRLRLGVRENEARRRAASVFCQQAKCSWLLRCNYLSWARTSAL